MAKKSDRTAFVSSFKEEIHSELVAARMMVSKAREATDRAWKKVQTIKSEISAAQRRLRDLEHSFQDAKSIRMEIAALKRRMIVIQKRIDELEVLQTNPVTLADINQVKAEIEMAEKRLEKALAEHEDAQWFLDQARANLVEVRLDTASERRLWWDDWDGEIDFMLE